MGRKGFYDVFDRVEECVKASLEHSLDELFKCIEAGEDWSSWVANHRPEVDVIACGFAIDPDAIETAIDRAAELLPIDRTLAIGVVGGIYSAVGARLRAGRALDSATVLALEDFANQCGGQ